MPLNGQVAVNRGPVGGRPVPAVFKAFDVSDNLREIFNVRVRPGEFSCFDGLRAITAGWVIIFHTTLWQLKLISNRDASSLHGHLCQMVGHAALQLQ
eukprot:34931-Eustigmatos_ZCMA.PRE.1